MNREGDGSSCDRRFGQGWSHCCFWGYGVRVIILVFEAVAVGMTSRMLWEFVENKMRTAEEKM